uniref:Uncharacterized protein n=1 Tax=Anguilla anguilla TaxID=7936 RepID=A0A0E9XYG3_ANGAN
MFEQGPLRLPQWYYLASKPFSSVQYIRLLLPSFTHTQTL